MFLLLLLLVSSSSSSLLVLYLLVLVTCVAVSLFSAFRERASRRVSRREGVTSHVPGKRNYTKTRASLAPSWFLFKRRHPPSFAGTSKSKNL